MLSDVVEEVLNLWGSKGELAPPPLLLDPPPISPAPPCAPLLPHLFHLFPPLFIFFNTSDAINPSCIIIVMYANMHIGIGCVHLAENNDKYCVKKKNIFF